MEVVGAKLPIPRVSKKFVTKPVAEWAHVGRALPLERSSGIADSLARIWAVTQTNM